MRILIYDNDINDLEQLFNMIKAFPIETIIDKVSDFNDTKNMFENHNYDKIFIDFNDHIGKNISKYIMQIKPTQEIILLNKDFECLDERDCSICTKMANKKILIKPINQQQLSKVISKNFICDCFHKNEFEFKLEKIKKLINQEFPYFNFNINKKELMIKSEPMTTTIIV